MCAPRMCLAPEIEYIGGVEQDRSEAARWFRLAAERGIAVSQLLLGSMYAEGLGVPYDLEQAAHWLKLCAKQSEENVQRREQMSNLPQKAKDLYRKVLAEMLRVKQDPHRASRPWLSGMQSEAPEGSTAKDVNQQTERRERGFCSVCGKPASLFCSKCKIVWYCSTEHQSSDWKSRSEGVQVEREGLLAKTKQNLNSISAKCA